MPPAPLIRPLFTRAQLRALATVGKVLGPEARAAFDDHRSTRALERAFDSIDDALDGALPDPFDADVEQLADLFADLRSHEMSTVIRARVRDLLAVLILWRAVEELSGVADVEGLLGVPSIDNIEWRAEVLDLLIDRGVEVQLPGEGR